MRYFTKDMWLGWQGDTIVDPAADWKKRQRRYLAGLERLRDRLSARSMQFFEDHSLHDGRVMSLLTTDSNAMAFLERKGQSQKEWPTKVELSVGLRDGYAYRLKYTGVRAIQIDFPSTRPLSPHSPNGFGDWLYDELTDARKSFLRHEVLFASGATLLIEFRSFGWLRNRLFRDHVPTLEH